MESDPAIAALSNGLADAVASASPSVVQVHGRRPVSGVVYADDVVVTNARALGREDAVRVRRHDGATIDAELGGWDPATGLAVLRTPSLGVPPMATSGRAARVGHLTIAVARSWSNHVTASAGIVAVVGGPLATGRRRTVEEVIRTTAPMHDGFAGGALIDVEGRLLGIATPAVIRGTGVVIPARIAWEAAASILRTGRIERGYLGIAGQPAALSEVQRQAEDRSAALLVVGVTPESPAAAAGILVGDLMLEFDGRPVGSAEDLLDLLDGSRVGRAVFLRLLRGTTTVTATVLVGTRPKP
jgi:S1-C subfamily serine protease